MGRTSSTVRSGGTFRWASWLPRWNARKAPGELAAAFRRAGLTHIKAGVRVVASGRLCWLDFAIESLKLAIEIDGMRAHSDAAVFQTDRVRQNALIADGWTVLRYTPWQIRHQLDAVLREITAVLQGLCPS